jgi:exosortase
MAVSFKAVAIIVATLAIYYQDLVIVVNDALHSDFMGYILFMPFLFGYLVYRKRKMIRASISFETCAPRKKIFPYKEVAGVLLLLITFLTYSYGSYTFTPLEYHIFTLPVFVASCILIMFNPQTLRHLAFPLLFLFFLTPPPVQTVFQAGSALSVLSSQAAYTILKALALPVSLTAEFGNPALVIQKDVGGPLVLAVDVACSGIYSLIGFLIFAIFIASIARTKIWKKTAIFFVGLPLIYALNVLRIIIIALIGNYLGMETAMQAFHLVGGWFLISAGTLLLLAVSQKFFKIQIFGTKSKTELCEYCNQNPQKFLHYCHACGKVINPPEINLSKRDLSKMVILILSAILVINLQIPVFVLTEGPAEVRIQVLASEQITTQILPEMSGYTITFIHRDKTFEEVSQEDAALTYAYIPNDASEPTVWVAIEVARTRSILHPWEVCLISWPTLLGYQPEVMQVNLRDIQLLQNPPVTARYFAFQYTQTNLTQVVLYWYENMLFEIGSSLEQKHVKVGVIGFSNSTTDIFDIESRLLPFAEAIASYWQPIKKLSPVTLTIAQNGMSLMALTTSLLAVVFAYQIIKSQKEKKSNLKLYNNLALEEEKLLLQAALLASKKQNPTGNSIVACYQKLSRKPMKSEVFFGKLNEAADVGLVKRHLVCRENEPILTWSPHISFFEVPLSMRQIRKLLPQMSKIRMLIRRQGR